MDLLTLTPRANNTKVSGDMPPVPGAEIVPSRPPVERPSRLGDPNRAARIVGDMVAGMPQNDQTATPDLTPVEKVVDTRTTLPRREVEP